MTAADAIRLVEILIWPLVAIVITVVVGFYQLARLAITGRGMQQRMGSGAERSGETMGFARGR